MNKYEKLLYKENENSLITPFGCTESSYLWTNENMYLYDNEDFWLTQKSMSKLFEVEVNTINYHLKEIFKSGS